MKRGLSIIGALVILFGFSTASAQEMPTPGPEHKMLKQMEGTWTAKVTMQGTESRGTVTSKMDLGGLWLLSEFKGDFFGQEYKGRGMDTYNPAKGKYVSVWADSMSTQPLVMEGTYDKEKKTLTMKGEATDPQGNPYTAKGVTEIISEDQHKFTMYVVPQDGVEIRMMTIEYTRNK